MAKFRFQMEAVIKVRKIAEDLAQRDFQLGQSHLLEQIELLNQMLGKKTEAYQTRHDYEKQGGNKAPHLIQVQDFLSGQDIRIEGQRKKIQYIETQVEQLREILREKAIDLKIIERLKEKKLEDFKLEQKKREVKDFDDVTMTRFASRTNHSRGTNEDGI